MLGDPVPPNFKGRGRPPHVPTDEKRKLVMTLWAMGKSNAFCAAALGISEPSFNRYYFKKAQRHLRDEARARIDGYMLNAVLKAVDEGNMAAVKQLRDMMHRADLERLSKHIARERDEDDRAVSSSSSSQRLGKKELRQRKAEKLTGIYEPGTPPSGGMVN